MPYVFFFRDFVVTFLEAGVFVVVTYIFCFVLSKLP